MKKYTQICEIAEAIRLGEVSVSFLHKYVTPRLRLDACVLDDLSKLVDKNPFGKLRDAFYFTILLENIVKDDDLIQSVNENLKAILLEKVIGLKDELQKIESGYINGIIPAEQARAQQLIELIYDLEGVLGDPRS